MAEKKFVVKNGLKTQNIDFVDDIGTPTNTISVSMLGTDTLSFTGNSGQLFSITDSQTGTIFAVNDISGVPSIEVDDDGTIRFAETFGNILIGTATDDGTNKLQVNGNIALNGAISADGSIGTNGQVLTSDGTKTYWSTSVGFTGSQGDTGFTGSQGELGYTGSQGAAGGEGSIGYTGSQGDTGFTGSIGFTGSSGDTGFTGSQGDNGFSGSQGDTGFTGSQGDTGFTGSVGFTGSFGYTGSQGDIGYTGSQGPEYEVLISETAPGGAETGDLWFNSNDASMYFYYTDVDTSQWVSISGPQGNIGFTGSQGVGFTGSSGDTGFTGSSGDTGFTGSSGDTGFTGSQGDTGFTGSIGFTGSQGTGFTGSQGDIGFTGSQGVGFTGSQGDTGFTGSQGDTGYTGSAGDTGFTGSTGVDGTLAETSDTAPTPAVDGQLWFDTTDTTLNVYYDDGDSSQWVTVSGERGLTGFTGSVGFTGSFGYTGSQGDIGYTGSQGPEYEVLISETAPGGAETGDLWFNSNDASMYFYYTDVDTSQWVSISGPQGNIGFTGSAGDVTTGKAIAMAIVFGG